MTNGLYFIANEKTKNYLLSNTEDMKKLVTTVCPFFCFSSGPINFCFSSGPINDPKDLVKLVVLSDDLGPKKYLNSAMECIEEATEIYQILSDDKTFTELNQIEIPYARYINKMVIPVYFYPGNRPIII